MDTTGVVQRPFLLGVNYWPRKKAMFWWRRFDAGEVRAEFAEIASWRLDLVRIFLMWEDFQPGPFEMSAQALSDLGTALDSARDNGLRVIVTFFVGQMSGINWAPSWALDGAAKPDATPTWSGGQPVDRAPAGIYQEPRLLRAQVYGLRAVLDIYAGHPAVYAWNITNENDNFLTPPSRDAAWLWNLLLCDEARRRDPTHPVTAGLHLADGDRYRDFRPADLAQGNDYLSIHAYSLYATWARGPLDPAVAPFSVALARALGGKEVMAEEFGVCTSPDGRESYTRETTLGGRTWQQLFASDAQAAAYYRETGAGLLRAGAIGALAWIFSDYDPSLYDTPPFNTMVHERYFGLTRHDGQAKPCLEAFLALKGQTAPDPLPLTLDSPPDDDDDDPARHFRELYAAFTRDNQAGV
jgi:endo-1,4-beta-mannosidase